MPLLIHSPLSETIEANGHAQPSQGCGHTSTPDCVQIHGPRIFTYIKTQVLYRFFKMHACIVSTTTILKPNVTV